MGTAALADITSPSKPNRRERAGKTVDAALRGGILLGAVAAIAWLLAAALTGVIYLVLIVVTVLDKARRARIEKIGYQVRAAPNPGDRCFPGRRGNQVPGPVAAESAP